MTPLLLLTSLLSPAHAAPPKYEIPGAVLAELRLLENDFELALAQDCDSGRCFAQGCTYVAHSVADRPRSSSLPGLGLDPGPGSVSAQEYLTQAECSFAHEKGADGGDMSALSRRLQVKLTSGWLTVSVNHKELTPLPPYLRTPPEAEDTGEAEEEAPPEPEPVVEEPWSLGKAGRQLWDTLLPHAPWMWGIVLLTLATVSLIWAARRMGAASIEEQALLAQLTQPGGGPAPEGPVAVEAVPEDAAEAFVHQERAAWTERLEAFDPAAPDPELQALIRELLRAGEYALLAKATLSFPERFPAAFPTGGDIASAKIELAEFLRDVDEQGLPDDQAFFSALKRHALFASLVTQGDARVVRSIREDFGTSGLARLIDALPARHGALLFALAPLETRHELVRLLSERQGAALAQQLLRSDRLDPEETADLFEALQAARQGAPLPQLPQRDEVSDHGAPFDAAGALSALLPALGDEPRAALFGEALRRYQGSLPTWTRGILSPEMLFALPDEARADLLLSVEVEALAAWVSLLDPELRARLLGAAPDSLRRSVEAVSIFPSRAQQLALAERGRLALARGFQAQLARSRVSFEQVVAPKGAPAT
ncbi:MAG: hypothetical protein H6740_10690 [Alphaproteobacteria bacterium]|nr:hypothetical protein [Alphaproteobacteria bacterium]